jgi:hypothetical protein
LPPRCTKPRSRERRVRSDVIDLFDAYSFAFGVRSPD